MTNDRLATQHAELTRFLFEAKDHGYADIQRRRPTAERDHSLTMGYESGDWRFHDNFFGGEPYGGRAVVFVKGRPLWMMVYYGWVDGTDADVQPVYSFLQGALRPLPSSRSAAPRSSRTGRSRTAWPSTAPSKTSGARRPFTETGGRFMRPASPVGSSTGGVASDGTCPPTSLAPGLRRPGYEGLVAKDPESPYVPGRTLLWLKVKQPKYREVERGFYKP